MPFLVFKLDDDDVRIDVDEEVVEYEEEEEEELVDDAAVYEDEDEGEENPLDLSRPAVSPFLYIFEGVFRI